LCAGTGQASSNIGAGNPALMEADRKLAGICALIRRISVDNPLWGAPRIHGELLKLGFDVSRASVAKYMVKRCGPPSQGWRTFLRNHAPDIAAIDLFVVPTIGFDLLYALVIVRLVRRDLVRINVTTHPTAEWIARQITEAFPWNEAPRDLIRDRDQVYGAAVMHRFCAMGIRDKPIAPRSPWQNGFAERLIGSIRRECVDHGVPRTYRWRRRYGAVQKMRAGPSHPAIRSWMQTAASCCR
jgi:transposase InsO family protein